MNRFRLCDRRCVEVQTTQRVQSWYCAGVNESSIPRHSPNPEKLGPGPSSQSFLGMNRRASTHKGYSTGVIQLTIHPWESRSIQQFNLSCPNCKGTLMCHRTKGLFIRGVHLITCLLHVVLPSPIARTR